MKCKAQEIQSRDMLRNAYRTMGEYFLSFLDVSTGRVLHKRGFGAKRLQKIFSISNSALNDEMKRMAADGEQEEETVLTVMWKLTRDLKMCGFDFDAETKSLEFDDPFERTWHTAAEKSKHAHRSAFAHRMRPPVSAYYLSILDYAHTELGYGKGRLHDLYVDLRKDYNAFLAAYLMCKQKGDDEAKRMIEERQNYVTKIGLKLIEF